MEKKRKKRAFLNLRSKVWLASQGTLWYLDEQAASWGCSGFTQVGMRSHNPCKQGQGLRHDLLIENCEQFHSVHIS